VTEPGQIQIRHEDGTIRHIDTLEQAWREGTSDSSIIKISFAAITGERVRLVRNATGTFELEPLLVIEGKPLM
jgi:hypothetical protein